VHCFVLRCRIRRLLDGDVALGGLPLGSLIRHGRSPASAQVVHRLAMIGLPLGAALVALTCTSPAPGVSPLPARLTAVRVPSVASAADEEDPAAPM